MEPSVLVIQAVFWIMTVLTIGGGIGVVTAKSLFHSALFLILSFLGVAGYYVLLSAGFLAVVQLAIYIGTIAILILFAIMFSRKPMVRESQANQQWWISLPISAVLLLALVYLVNTVAWPVSGVEPEPNTVQQLGVAFLGGYLIPFEVVSVLLSVALIGAIILAREKSEAEEELR